MIRPRRPLLRALASEIHAIRPMHACRASSKSSPAPRRLAGPRRSLRQLQTGLQRFVEVFASLKQACMDSIYSKPASSRLAWTQFTVNQLQAGLHGSDIQYITLKQACMARYTVYHAQTGLHGSDIQYISPKQACTAPIYSISSTIISPQKRSPPSNGPTIHARGTFSCDRQSARLTDDRRRCHLGEADDCHGPQAPCSLQVSA